MTTKLTDEQLRDKLEALGFQGGFHFAEGLGGAEAVVACYDQQGEERVFVEIIEGKAHIYKFKQTETL